MRVEIVLSPECYTETQPLPGYLLNRAMEGIKEILRWEDATNVAEYDSYSLRFNYPLGLADLKICMAEEYYPVSADGWRVVIEGYNVLDNS